MYTIAGAKQAVKHAVKGYLYKDADGTYVMKERNRVPLYLEGAPGIGKTELTEQVAQELGLGFVSFSLVHHTRNSLLGLPVIETLESGDKYTTYTMSEVIAKVQEQVDAGMKEGILLLDEFPCMSETIMPAMLAFLQTKNIGEHRLPEGWVIVLCGNPVQYNKSARKFDSAVLDRLRKIEIEFEAACFIEYGKKIGLEPLIMDYLELRPEHVYRCREKEGVRELVTCRGWENLSHALRVYEELGQELDEECVRQFIKSEEICESFIQYVQQCQVGISREEMEDILEGMGFEHYKERILKLSMKQRMQVADYVCEVLEVRPTMAGGGKAKYRQIGQWIGNVMDMMKEVDPTGILEERVVQKINNSDLLYRTVSNVEVPQYLAYAAQVAGDVQNKFLNLPVPKVPKAVNY